MSIRTTYKLSYMKGLDVMSIETANKVSLKGYKVCEMYFCNKLTEGTEVQLKNEVNYNVNYSDTENKCIGVCVFNVKNRDAIEESDFRIKIEIRGIFEYENLTSKKIVHAETFKELFPYIKQIVSTLTTTAGMPPLVIPTISIDADTVNVHEGAKNNNSPLIN